MMSEDRVETIEIALVLEAIRARYGYDFRGYAPDSISRRVKAALARSGVPHLGELCHRLLNDPVFFGSMIGDLTVQVSGMFRDPTFYRAFRTEVIPVLRTYPQIKVWHAGCANGEEVYATAILFQEEGLYDRTQFYGTDVSQAAIERAREGIYPELRASTYHDDYAAAGGVARLEDYYTQGYGQMAIRESLRKNTVFFQHDLVTDHSLGEMHVIFCRNVFIYFGGPLRLRVLELFEGGLRRGGFLCLGSSESIPPDAVTSLSPFVASERIYRKREDA